MVMNTADRDRFIADRLNEGLSLSEVQRRLADELGIKLTYLDLRLIVADLEVDWAKQEPPTPAKEAKTPTDTDLLDDTPDEEPGRGRTRVTVSKLVRPGTAMSGDVVFASGARGEWFVDAMGRLGLNPAEGSGKPTQEDIREFQIELQRVLSGGGR